MNSPAAVSLARRFSTAAQVVYLIDFTKDNVQRTDDCGNIGQHVAPAEEVQHSLALRTLSVDKRSDQPQQRIVFWPNGLFRKKLTQPYRRSLAAGRFARLVHHVDMARLVPAKEPTITIGAFVNLYLGQRRLLMQIALTNSSLSRPLRALVLYARQPDGG